MERAAHGKLDRALRSGFLCELHRALDPGDFTGDDYLFVGVEVCRNDQTSFLARAIADLFNWSSGSAKDRGHSAWTRCTGLEHELTAAPHKPGCAGESDRIRRVVGSEFSERVSGGGAHLRTQDVFRQRPYRCAVSEQSRLRV